MLNSNPLKSSVKKTPADPVPTVLPEELYCLRTGRGYPVSAEEMPEITINATCSLTYKESVNAQKPPPRNIKQKGHLVIVKGTVSENRKKIYCHCRDRPGRIYT
ncbi:hypothetical protein BOW29_11780 [Solemya velum gill symbiont]|nr:hypothetical protein BOW29_11780 [Solemya velum gill symbiont]